MYNRSAEKGPRETKGSEKVLVKQAFDGNRSDLERKKNFQEKEKKQSAKGEQKSSLKQTLV